MLKTEKNPGGLPIAVFDGIRAGSLANRSQLYKDIASGPFFGFNRPGAKASQGLIDSFWLQGMQAGHKNAYDSIKAFSETDFTEDLKKFDVPTLIVHGDDDQIVPIGAAGLASAKLVPHATLKVYAGAPHGLADTHKDQLNADMRFLRKAADTRRDLSSSFSPRYQKVKVCKDSHESLVESSIHLNRRPGSFRAKAATLRWRFAWAALPIGLPPILALASQRGSPRGTDTGFRITLTLRLARLLYPKLRSRRMRCHTFAYALTHFLLYT